MPFFLTTAGDWFAGHGSKIAGIVLVALIVDLLLQRLVPRAVHLALERGMTGKGWEAARQRADTLSHVFTRTGRTFVVLLAFFTILPEFDINIGPLLAGLGITGLAIALGAQALVRDAITGIFILIENQYGNGDVVRIADVTGTVEGVTLRRTILRDEDGVVHSIPNGTISVVSNYTRDFAQVNVQVRVAYGEDLSRVAQVIDRVGRELAADERFREEIMEPPRSGRIEAWGDQGVALTVTARTRPAARWDIAGELRRRLADAFLAEGVRVPFPVVTDGEGQNPPG